MPQNVGTHTQIRKEILNFELGNSYGCKNEGKNAREAHEIVIVIHVVGTHELRWVEGVGVDHRVAHR